MHLDPNLDTVYADLSRNNSLGWIITEGAAESAPEYGPEYACMRQIAFELNKTINGKPRFGFGSGVTIDQSCSPAIGEEGVF
jgi:hypothetical protein